MSKDLQTLVVGGGFAGLFVARALAQSGHRVCLIEPETELGGSLRGYDREGNKFDSCLQIWPDPDSTHPAWRWAQECLRLQIPNLNWTRREERPRTYAHSQWVEFAGFGDSPPEYVEDLAPWLIPTWGECDPLLASVIRGLAQNPTQGPQVEFLKAWVTALEVSEGQCRGVWINSTKKIEAARVYWCAPIEALRRCLPAALSPERSRMKASSWVGLDWHCSDSSFESSAYQVLFGSGEDQLVFLGRHLGKGFSQWMTLMDFEEAENEENVSHVIKKMKRTLKKLFPQLSDSLVFERLAFFPEHRIHRGFKHKSGRLTGLKDFQILFPSLSPRPGLLGFFEFAWEQLKDRSELQFELSNLDFTEGTNTATSETTLGNAVNAENPSKEIP